MSSSVKRTNGTSSMPPSPSSLLWWRMDPTRAFALICIAIMLLRFLQAGHSLSDALFGFFLNPYVVFFMASAVITVYVALPTNRRVGNHTSTLSTADAALAEWYFWNACLFHAIMDGASGSLRLVPVVVHTYDMLDLRFPTHHSVPFVVGLLELLLMYPLCLACIYCILQRRPERYPLELLTSTLHWVGMVLFVFCEVYEGQCHVPALDPVGRCVARIDYGPSQAPLQWRFNLYHFTYYWFGFWFCNGIWGVVPLYRIGRALQECQRAFLRERKID